MEYRHQIRLAATLRQAESGSPQAFGKTIPLDLPLCWQRRQRTRSARRNHYVAAAAGCTMNGYSQKTGNQPYALPRMTIFH